MRSTIFQLISFVGLVAAAATDADLTFTKHSLAHRRISTRAATTVESDARTDSVLSLKRAKGTSMSSAALNLHRAKVGQVSLLEAELGEVFISAITLGNQTFEAIIDTGSSDTWVVETGFTCVDPTDNSTLSEAACDFGTPYSPSGTLRYIDNENFNISYADGEYLNGYMAYETVTLAGITVPRQQIAVAYLAGWDGDGITSGLIGLAYPDLTSAYYGTNASADSISNVALYPPVLTSMFDRNDTAPFFSMALSRDESQSGNGGLMAIGGLPTDLPGGFTAPFASTPIDMNTLSFLNGSHYFYYTITIDGLSFSSHSRNETRHHDGPRHPHAGRSKTTVKPTFQPTSKVSNVTLVDAGVEFIVDSGTTLNYVPTDTAAAVNALFSPPGFSDEGNWLVYCNATAPTFDVHIGGATYHTNPFDMVAPSGDGSDMCLSGIQDGGSLEDGPFILGDVFLKNVLAVFDVGTTEMRFAAREFYPS